MYIVFSENDFRLYHSWGKKPYQKAREREYNHEYYLKNKEKWKTRYSPKGIKEGIKDVLGYDERDALTKASHETAEANRRYENAEARADYAQREYLETKSKYNSGEYFDKDHPWNNGPNKERVKSIQTYNRQRQAYDTLLRTQGVEREAYLKYSKTPLGAVENFTKAGKEAIANALDSLSKKIRR